MSIIETSREIPAQPEAVFAAFSNPERLARWWGPAGFTNTFSVCEFKDDCKWSFVMHAPNGANYQNESVFTEIVKPSKVVVDHISEPKFQLTIELTPTASGTNVTWSQNFASAEVAAKIKAIVVPANEQNLDRLTAEVLRTAAS